MDKFLLALGIPKLYHKDINHPNRSIPSNGTDAVIVSQ
jgi:hypothetical protein